jgi:hypothetical protein
LSEIIQILHKKIELDHIVGTGKKVNRKKRVQGLNSEPQNRRISNVEGWNRCALSYII